MSAAPEVAAAAVGERVTHPKFGLGTIVAVEGRLATRAN